MNYPKRPSCGGNSYMYGPSNSRFPASFVCYGCNPYGSFFSEDTPGVDVARCRESDSASKSLSRSNAESLKKGEV